MSLIGNEPPSADDHDKAALEVAFLLDIFASTIDDLMGGATASVSRIAGRSMAQKFPVTLHSPDLREAISAVAGQMHGGFDFSASIRDCHADMTFNKCAIRQMCQDRNVPLGGPICKLFHYYLDGVLNEMYSRPVKSQVVSTGPQCKTTLETK
jgi:hypothetical protein